jgi:hypothetical protein
MSWRGSGPEDRSAGDHRPDQRLPMFGPRYAVGSIRRLDSTRDGRLRHTARDLGLSLNPTDCCAGVLEFYNGSHRHFRLSALQIVENDFHGFWIDRAGPNSGFRSIRAGGSPLRSL